jgi:hypothetical protein
MATAALPGLIASGASAGLRALWNVKNPASYLPGLLTML